MDAIGVVAEARNIAQSTVRRIENYLQGRKDIQERCEANLALLTDRMEESQQTCPKISGRASDDVAVCSTELWNCVRS